MACLSQDDLCEATFEGCEPGDARPAGLTSLYECCCSQVSQLNVPVACCGQVLPPWRRPLAVLTGSQRGMMARCIPRCLNQLRASSSNGLPDRYCRSPPGVPADST